VEFANGHGTHLANTGGVANTPLANQAIHPDETVRLGPGMGHVVLTGYNSNVVPGALAEMTLTFQNGQTVKVPATVEASPAAETAAQRPQ
jgi:copper(I)-binding protein